MKQALTVKNVMKKNREIFAFKDDWLKSFGMPERSGSWLIWGESGSGKTSFAMQLVKYLAQFPEIYRVAYNSLEEGNSQSIKMAIERVGMIDVADKFWLLDMEPIEELKVRIQRKRSPQVLVIESVQYMGLKYPEYVKLRSEFPDKLFIFISHADGRNPQGRTAKAIRFDAFVKIRIEGYAAFVVSRYRDGRDKPFVIWPEGAELYHGQTILI
ncbi:MAG: hypothetical protein R2764_01355 [Bacteroidales bacterium]